MIWAWLLFGGLVALMLALDLGVFHRQARAISVKEAVAWSALWIALGLAFGCFIYFGYELHWFGLGLTPDAIDGVANDGRTAMEKYLTGYVVEKSLSIDNIFVVSMIFSAVALEAKHQHRVLFWGIGGAVVMRGAMIAVGSRLIHEFHWVLYVFAAVLIMTGLKMLFAGATHADPERNLIVKTARRVFPRATPFVLAIIMVEAADLIFAVDSIPAIFAITADPFLVFTSNVFALLGMRSLYFALAGMMGRFRLLKPALALILIVVGSKMLLADVLKEMLGRHFNFVLLGVVVLILAGGVVGSMLQLCGSARSAIAPPHSKLQHGDAQSRGSDPGSART